MLSSLPAVKAVMPELEHEAILDQATTNEGRLVSQVPFTRCRLAKDAHHWVQKPSSYRTPIVGSRNYQVTGRPLLGPETTKLQDALHGVQKQF